MSREKVPMAFPPNTNYDDGMSLRDYFAAKAMQGIVSHVYYPNMENNADQRTAARAYLIADEMLKARDE